MANERENKGVYMASAWLATLVEDLQQRGLLEGEVRESVAQSLELFRSRTVADPQEAWHVELLDQCEELHGHQPEEP